MVEIETGDNDVHAAAPKNIETTTAPTVEAAAAAAAVEDAVLAGVAAAAAPAAVPGEGKAAEDSFEGGAITDACDASGALSASPSVAAAASIPSFPRSTTDAEEETNAAAAVAPTGATFLSGSVGADVFASRTGEGAQPWPGLSDEDSSVRVEDGFGGSSSKRRISFAEAAAFMGTGSTVTGGSGGHFATGSSWAESDTFSATADEDQIVAVPTTVPTESPAAAGDAASAVGRPLFIGRDDFLSCPSVRMGGLGLRRANSDAALSPKFASAKRGGVVAEGVRDLGSRRSTAGELVGRGGDDGSNSRNSRSSVEEAAPVAEVKTEAAAVSATVLDGAPNGIGDDGGDTADEGGVLTTTKASAEENPGQTEEVAGPALLVRQDGSGESAKTAVVETFASVPTEQQGRDICSGSAVHVVNGGVVVKNSGVGVGGDFCATTDSAATSDAGGAEVARPPPREVGTGGTVPSPGATTRGSGGCCVVS